MIFTWLCRKLGLDDIHDDQALMRTQINNRLDAIELEITKLRSDITVTFHDETSPKRKELSDAIGQKMITRLKAEDMARKMTTGEL